MSGGDGFGWLGLDRLGLDGPGYGSGVWLGGDFGGFGGVVEGGRVGIGRSDASVARGEDEFGEAVGGGLDEEHVAVGAIEESSEDLGGGVGSVGSEDALVGDASGDLHGGLSSDLAEDLVEAGVAGGDGEEIIGEGNGSALGCGPGWLRWRGGLDGGGCGWWQRGIGLGRQRGDQGEEEKCRDAADWSGVGHLSVGLRAEK